MKKWIILLGLVGIMLSINMVVNVQGESTDNKLTQDKGKPSGKLHEELSEEEIKRILDRLYSIQSPDGFRMMADYPITQLSWQGNKIIPFLDKFLESKKGFQRDFAIGLLIKIGTDKSLSIVYDKFWNLYRQYNNAGKIEAGTAALAYHSSRLYLNSVGKNAYWEARGIFRGILSIDSDKTANLCEELVAENNGIGVMASKYLWRNKGEKYGKEFFKYSNSAQDEETYYTFVKEFTGIVIEDKEDNFKGIGERKKEFNKKAISMCNSTDIDKYVLENLIRYLSKSEPDWFADNWVRLYKQHKADSRDNLYMASAFKQGLLNNDKAKQNMKIFRDTMGENKYEKVMNYIREHERRKKEQEKWEGKQK